VAAISHIIIVASRGQDAGDLGLRRPSWEWERRSIEWENNITTMRVLPALYASRIVRGPQGVPPRCNATRPTRMYISIVSKAGRFGGVRIETVFISHRSTSRGVKGLAHLKHR